MGDGHTRVPGAQGHHHLGGCQRSAAQGEEVRLRPVHDGTQDVLPLRGEPTHGAAELRADVRNIARRRPRQGVAIDLPRRAGGQFVDQHQAGNQRCRQRSGEVFPGSGQVEGGVGGGDIANQHRGAAGGLAHRGGSAADTGKVHQRRVHLAEFDPAPADLHLIVGPALEVQAVGLESHQIPAAVGPRPTQRRHRGVLLGVFLRIEVPGQPDAADHQLPDLARCDRFTGGVDHGQIPARQRQPDADRRAPGELRSARDHGGLGGSVGVPHLAAVDRESFGKIGRAGLAAEDQQSNRLQRLSRPQRRQGGHRRHHGDVAGDQPRSEIHPAAHQCTRGRHQARTVPPGQPHLLAGGVESDRQTGQDPVVGSDRTVLQEHPGLGVDECGGVAVADGHAFRGTGGSGGEDDPGVIADLGWCCRPSSGRSGAAAQPRLGDDAGHSGLGEHQLRPLIGVVGIHRNVCCAGGQDGEDRQVQRIAAGGHPDSDPVAPADPAGGQPPGSRPDVPDHLAVCQLDGAVVDRGRIRVTVGGVVDDVDERSR